MDHQASLRDNFDPRWETNYLKFLVLLVMLTLLTACEVLQPSPPPTRDFSTADLVIDPSLLPTEWSAAQGPHSIRSDMLGRTNLGGSSIHLENTESNADHIVAIFANANEADHVYNDHIFSGDTQGRYARTWETPPGFAYDSAIADQFRAVCVDIKNKSEIGEIGEICAVEGQYDEFVSILIYRTTNPNSIITDLEILSKAIDTTSEKYLGK